MAINTSLGTKFYIGPITPSVPATESAYAALSYQEIGSIQSISEFGDQAGAINFTDLGASRVRKFKGARDAGQITVQVANDPADAGQQAAIEAEKTKFDYAVKVVLADAADANDTNSTFFFTAKVSSVRMNVGDANSMLMRSLVFDIDSAVLEVPSEVVSGP
jgi:hypothetical protein